MNAKPVFEVTTETMWNYKYQAKYYLGAKFVILASNSLRNLKDEVKARGWSVAWITAKEILDYNQKAIDEYPYQPRRKR